LTQYTEVHEEVDFEGGDYKKRDLVLEWDTKMGEPENIIGCTKFCLGPFRVEMNSFNNSYYLSTLEGRRRSLTVCGHLLKSHQGENN
jgi:hypothetical protein